MTRSLVWRGLVLAILSLALTAAALGQAEPTESAADSSSKDPLAGLKFRNLGPAVGGGRVAAVAGVPGEPGIYYVGAAAGGVFKTTDGGLSWKPIFEREATASIGAIALAPSNPNLVWVGTGESNPRNDVVTGRGVYFSPDAGASWKFMGLADAGQISSIIVHPTNPDVVYVGVLGHVWGPNPDRGVFRTTDGGKTWQKVLFVNDKTGASDLIMDPGNPMVLFAGLWEVQRYPWMLVSGGTGSGIYRSVDGGATWKQLTEGLPAGPLGRIGLAAAPGNPHHIYALVEAKKGMLWESQDLGDHWRAVSNSHIIDARPFYFTRLFVAPDSDEHIYFLSYDILESTDGGKTAHIISRGVHPDNHALWMDPGQPSRMIEGNDGGVYITADAGKTWRFLDNLPIEQFYMVAADDRDPYMLCGGLQDNNGWCGPSNSLSRGGIHPAEWWTATGGDGEYVVPAPGNSHIVYSDSQNGNVRRLDYLTGQASSIRPYLAGVSELKPADLKYRFNWTSPIAVSDKDPDTVYIGGNVLFKSTDGGQHWSPISPDLTRNDKSKQESSGGPIELDLSGAESFGEILSFSVSPVDPNVIWTGSDDGLVQVTKDGGKTWTNVTAGMKGLPEWGRVQQIEASPFAANTAYVAVDFHEVENNKPYVFKTHDFGKTWTAISAGLPETDPARVLRENPNHRGMLVLGSDTGLFYSMDEGEHWTALKSNFPTVPVYDLKFIKRTHDLVVATHGRGLFVMDNITPLEESNAQVLASDFHAFTEQRAYKWLEWNKHALNSAPLGAYTAPNPATGAVIDYFLKAGIEAPAADQQRGGRRRASPVKIEITDATTGEHVRTMDGTAHQGYNRVTWNLAYDTPTRLAFLPPPAQGEGEGGGFFGGGGGPPVVPGSYKVAITVNGKTETQTVEVQQDPRFNIPLDNFRAQTRAALEVRDEISALNEALNRIESLKSQVTTVQRLLAGDQEAGAVVNASYTPVLQQARALSRKLTLFEETIYNTEAQPGSQDRLHYLAHFHDKLQGLMRATFGDYGQPPRDIVLEEMAAARKELQTHLASFNDLLKTDVAAFNKLALDKGANTLFAGNPIELKEPAGQGGK